MKKKGLLTLVIFSLCTSLFSQQYLEVNPNNAVSFRLYQPPDKIVEGSPFLIDTWAKGQIKFNDGEESTIDSLKYNVYSGNIIFKYRGSEYCFDKPQEVDYFLIGNMKFKRVLVSKDEKGFMELLADGGKIKLLKDYSCKILEGKKSNGITADIPDRYSKGNDYYTIINDQPAQKFKKSKKEILELMANHKEEINNFIKTNSIKTSKDEDLIKLFNYYNTLN